MCGISCYFARESVVDFDTIDKLLMAGEKRGSDGFGCCLIKPDSSHPPFTFRTVDTYSKVKERVKAIYDIMEIGDIFIAISRAAPETEPMSSLTNMQPLVNKDCVLVHNGAVSQKIQEDIKSKCEDKYEFLTQIDSECILASYFVHNKNIKDAMEYISGGVAAILYDYKIRKLFMVTDFKPIAQCYIKGYGYFLSSSIEPLDEIIENICATKRDGICLWENYYHHYWDGQYIYGLDIDSGFIQQIKYSPRFIAQKFDSNKEEYNKDEELCLVSASGGLDSTMTLWALKNAGYKNIIACHFKYGHRGQDCEKKAIRNICNYLDIELKMFDVETLFKSINTTSMLIDEGAEVTTGTNGLKDVDAWVCGRNMLFMSIMASYAESLVMKDGYSKINFLGGFLNLSESGVYPDNSEYFIDSCLNMFKYGTLIGNKIQVNYGLSDLMKSDLLYLIKYFELYDLYNMTISCDRPKLVEKPLNPEKHKEYLDALSYLKNVHNLDLGDGTEMVPCNCSSNGKPACGSGALSYWAAKMVGLDDMKLRNFYDIKDPNFKLFEPDHMKSNKILEKDINQIIEKIKFPKDKIENLKKLIKMSEQENKIIETKVSKLDVIREINKLKKLYDISDGSIINNKLLLKEYIKQKLLNKETKILKEIVENPKIDLYDLLHEIYKQDKDCMVDFIIDTFEPQHLFNRSDLISSLEAQESLKILDIFPENDLKEFVSSTYNISEIYDDDYVKDYFKDDFMIDEIFEEKDIKDYVKDTFVIDDIFDKDNIIEFVRENYDIDDVFNNEKNKLENEDKKEKLDER